MILASFFVSAIAASGNPQFATGPQKWVLKIYNQKIDSSLSYTSHLLRNG